MSEDRKVLGMDGKPPSKAVLESPYKVGDVVSLRFGGRPMVVTELDGDEAGVIILCAWHSDNGTPYESAYPPEVLTLAKTECS